MTKQQEIRLASRLEQFAPCIHAVNWLAGAIDSIEYDRARIDHRFLGSLRHLCRENGIALTAC